MNERIKELAVQVDPHVYERFDAGDIQELLDKFAELIVRECVNVVCEVDDELGIYPAAVKGFNDERDYEQRDGFKNGWNMCVMEFVKEARLKLIQHFKDE